MNRKKIKGNCSLLWGTGIGTAAAIILNLILTAVAALMIVNETISENALNYFTFIILLLSAFVGALLANKLVMQKYALVTAVVVVTYLLMLLSVALLCFDGTLTGVLLSVLAVVAGGLASCAVCIRTAVKGIRRKYRPR